MEKITRDELYELVWTTPISALVDKFGVPPQHWVRACAALRVPRPPNGHWSKLSVGTAAPQPPLPPSRPGDESSWSPGTPLPKAIARPRYISEEHPATSILLPWDAHELIRSATPHFLKNRVVGDGQYLKPFKRLMADITTTMDGLEKALGFANKLYSALEAAGHPVALYSVGSLKDRPELGAEEFSPEEDPGKSGDGCTNLWRPGCPTVAYEGETRLGLAIIEMTEKVPAYYIDGRYIRVSEAGLAKAGSKPIWWVRLPSGRLRLVVYSPYAWIHWSTSFQESKDKSLDEFIPQIIKKFSSWAAKLTAENQRADRVLAKDREEAAKKASRKELDEICQDMARILSAEKLFHEMANRTKSLPPSKRKRLLNRLDAAREFIGAQAPIEKLLAWQSPSERLNNPLRDASLSLGVVPWDTPLHV